MKKEVLAKRFIHSCRVSDWKANTETIIVKEHHVHPDGTYTPSIGYVKDPKRSFYVTKESVQKFYDEKKEWEELKNLDQYTCRNIDLPDAVFKALRGFRPNRRGNLRELSKSPYLYGSDISIESLMINNYQKKFDKTGAKYTPITTGFCDFETDMKTGEPLCGTITHENKVYTAILDRFFHTTDDQGNKVPCSLNKLKEMSLDVFNKVEVSPDKKKKVPVMSYGFEFEYYVAKDALDLITWLINKSFENMTDFIGAWNLAFDLGKVILGVCNAYDVDPKDILSHPSIPEELRSFKFVEDTNPNVDHISRRWHWAHMTSPCQWYDAMQLYSRLRIVDGFEISYSLDNILRTQLNSGKLYFPNVVDSDSMTGADWHRYMQKHNPYEYIIYNQYDCMGIQIMEWKNQDVAGMVVLSETNYTPLANFNKQTRKAANELHFICLNQGKVVASTYTSDEADHDGVIKEGGAVLDAFRTDGVGLSVLNEKRNLETYVSRNVVDSDLSAIYPTADQVCNVSRETRIASLTSIEGHNRKAVQMFCSMVVSPQENAVHIGSMYFNLPSFSEAEELYSKYA